MLVPLYSILETTVDSAPLNTHCIVQCCYNLKIIMLTFTKSFHQTDENINRYKKYILMLLRFGMTCSHLESHKLPLWLKKTPKPFIALDCS